ncbi:hypothetical protein HGRIS_011835 [Hohenbuehelia grisea]|uniref:Uncharacterized protein n=1 Tax=Hohenbuehelia grisea TaxID=104357 RepID=A0ABR3JXE3_9AGAR
MTAPSYSGPYDPAELSLIAFSTISLNKDEIWRWNSFTHHLLASHTSQFTDFAVPCGTHMLNGCFSRTSNRMGNVYLLLHRTRSIIGLEAKAMRHDYTRPPNHFATSHMDGAANRSGVYCQTAFNGHTSGTSWNGYSCVMMASNVAILPPAQDRGAKEAPGGRVSTMTGEFELFFRRIKTIGLKRGTEWDTLGCSTH